MIHELKKFVFATIAYFFLTSSIVNSQNLDGLNSVSGPFPEIEENLELKFPEDHGSHNEYRIEWWYLTANLRDENNNPLGLQWTLFRAASEPNNNKKKWNSSQIWMGHAALTGKDFHLVEEKLARDDVSQAGVTTQPFEAWIDDWSLKGPNWKNLTVNARGKNFQYNLKLKAKGPIIKHGDNGRSVKSSSGQASAYYSQPFFHAEGWIKKDDERRFVKGSAWADHEWSSQFISVKQEGWDWFSVNFNTGEKLMLFQVREKNKNNFYYATWINEEGVHQPVKPSEIILEPYEPKDRYGYYTSWRIKLKSFGVDIKTTALNSSSRMNTIYPYWEGPIKITGSHSGNGYLEMTGYIDQTS